MNQRTISFRLLVAFSLAELCNTALAQNKRLILPAIFSDHMVLQAGKALPVWGEATPRVSITVSFNEQTAHTIADEYGNWKLQLKALQASFKPANVKNQYR